MKFLGLASGDYLTLYKSFPVDSDGFVKDPRCLPKLRKEKYLNQWRAWCKEHPSKDLWPDFIHAIILETQHEKAKAA